MTLRSSHGPATRTNENSDTMDRLEELVAPALLQLKESCDTCPSTYSTPTASCPDCPECRNGGSENGFNLQCARCFTDCASPCNDDDCDIPKACFDEHCATECVDDDCEDDPCDTITCAEPLYCKTTCFDTNCLYPTAGGQLGTFDPHLCEQGQCYGFLPCGSGIPQDFSLSHNISNHYPQPIFSHNPHLWDHSIPSYHSHEHTNLSNSHKRRRLDGSSSRSSMQSDNCYQPQFDWQAWQSNNCLGSGSSHFNFQSQADQQSDIVENNGWQGGNFDQLFPASSTFTHSSNNQLQQNANRVSYSTTNSNSGFVSSSAALSSTSDIFLAARTNLASGTTANLSTMPPDAYLSSTAVQHAGVQLSNPGYSELLEGLTCQLSHVSGFEGSMPISKVDHSPYCSVSTAKRSAPMSDTAKATPTRFQSPERSVTNCSPGLPDLTRSSTVETKADLGFAEINLTCKWVLVTFSKPQEPDTCSQTFFSSKELDDHIQKEHTNKLGAQQFVCGWLNCNTPFKHRGKLNRHIAGAHSRYHAHHCSHCERTFCTKEQLKNHETTHTGEKKYKCSFCDHTSATKTQHNTHERTHTKEKPYACLYCSHRSGDSSNLSKHMKNKHAEERTSATGPAGRSRVKAL